MKKIEYTEIENLMKILESKKGNKIKIVEQISNFKENFDRHFTSTNSFIMDFDIIQTRFSGARVCLVGNEIEPIKYSKEGIMYSNPSSYYEISIDDIKEINYIDNKIIIVEKLSNSISRKTDLIF